MDQCLDSIACWAVVSAAIGLAGFGAWQIFGSRLPDKLFEACLAISAAAGVISGFLGAGLLFLSTVNNELMRSIRTKHGDALHRTLLFSVALGMAVTLAIPVVALFLTGWGARMFLCVSTAELFASLAKSLVVIGGVLGTTLEDARSARPSPPKK